MAAKRRAKTGHPSLDARDRTLVEALRKDAWQSYAALAELVHLSASAVQRRVERLIDAGIIQGATARIGHEALGQGLLLYVLVELRDEGSATLNGFARKLAACSEVAEAHYVTGSFDVVVVVRAVTMADYAAFAARVLNDSPLIRRYRTLTTLRALV